MTKASYTKKESKDGFSFKECSFLQNKNELWKSSIVHALSSQISSETYKAPRKKMWDYD